jgi:hypothetical protein
MRTAGGQHRVSGLLEKADSIREEQQEVYPEIDNIVARIHSETVPEAFDFTPQKKDSRMPIIINLAALGTLIAGMFLLFWYYNIQERDLTTPISALTTAEGWLIEAVKAESAEQLQAKEEQIAGIQSRLAITTADRDRLVDDMDSRILQRESELRASMALALEAEKEHLQQEGISEQEVQARMDAMESSLSATNQQEMELFRGELEAEMAETERIMNERIADYDRLLQQTVQEQGRLQELLEERESELAADFQQQVTALESERSSIEQQYAELREERERESAALNRIYSYYSTVERRISRSEYDLALRELNSLADYLRRRDIATLPAIRQRQVFERFVMATVRDTIVLETEAGEEKRGRTVVADKLLDLKGEFEDLAANAAQEEDSAQKELLALLETKVLVRQIVSSEPLKSEYPDLAVQLDAFLQAFELEQQQRGKTAALRNMLALLNDLEVSEGNDNLQSFGNGTGSVYRDMAKLLGVIASLLE